ncbi:MAG: alpha/beta hydrolase [Saprospiraceae bacterium]
MPNTDNPENIAFLVELFSKNEEDGVKKLYEYKHLIFAKARNRFPLIYNEYFEDSFQNSVIYIFNRAKSGKLEPSDINIGDFLFYIFKLNIFDILLKKEKNNELFNKPRIKFNLEKSIQKVSLLKSDTNKEEKGGKAVLFYGTNRNRTNSKRVNNYYGDMISDLQYGYCEVTIPRGHIQGDIERPRNFLVFELPENDSKHIVLSRIKELTEKQFLDTLNQSINNLPVKSAMIFIHGYNNTFAQAARRAAQIAWDIPFNGLSGFYSWPSSGKTVDYLGDVERADATIPLLEQFIEGIILKTGIEKLHLIAHSMGNRLMTVTINNLSNKPALAERLKIIHQIVLAAPDLDQDVFMNTILPRFSTLGHRRTLYSSDKDSALQLSEFLRGGRPRLGDAGDNLFVANGVDTVDASNIKSSGNQHSYIFDTKELLADLYYLLHNEFPPIDRRLQARIKNKLTYWLFPK